MSIIDSLNWRYATTKFDTNRVVADSDIKKLKEIVSYRHLHGVYSFIK